MPKSSLLPEGAARTAMAALLDAGPLSCAELVRMTALPEQTVSAAIAALEGEGWIRRTDGGHDGAGKAAPLFAPDPESCYAVGIDLGGTRLRVALADLSGAIVEEADEAADPDASPIDRIAALAAALLRQRRIAPGRLRGAALAIAGVPDPRAGAVLLAPNLPGLGGIDVAAELARALGCPARVENDVNMAALGESRMGQGGEDFAFVAFGTGIGMGLISGGRLIRGARGGAGEIAWLPIGRDPFDPASHAHGALETAIGSQALVARYRALGGHAPDVRGLFDKVAAGDPAALEVIDEAARLLAAALVAIRAIADPARVVLGGSIGIRPELIARLRAWLARADAADLHVQESALGSRAALVGAAGLGLTTARAALLQAAAEDAPPPGRA